VAELSVRKDHDPRLCAVCAEREGIVLDDEGRLICAICKDNRRKKKEKR
jgi:hypothetical protein